MFVLSEECFYVINIAFFFEDKEIIVPLFLIFIFLPLLEIGVFISVGDNIGLLNTLGLSLLTAIIGGLIFRYQGFSTFRQATSEINRGGLPVKELFDGFCLVIAAAMLVTPGFVTDTFGFLLLVPAVRAKIRKFLLSRMSVSQFGMQEGVERKGSDPGAGDTIEGEFERVDENRRKE